MPWLVSYVETLLVQTWYPMTVATNSFHHKLKEIHMLELLLHQYNWWLASHSSLLSNFHFWFTTLTEDEKEWTREMKEWGRGGGMRDAKN